MVVGAKNQIKKKYLTKSLNADVWLGLLALNAKKEASVWIASVVHEPFIIYTGHIGYRGAGN